MNALTSAAGLPRRAFLHGCATAALGLAVQPFSPEAEATTSRTSIVAGLEIGTAKICVAVGERDAEGCTRLLGVCETPAVRPQDGQLDLERVAERVRATLAAAERLTDCLLQTAAVAIGGSFHGRTLAAGELDDYPPHHCRANEEDGFILGLGSAQPSARGNAHFFGDYRAGLLERLRCLEAAGVQPSCLVLLPAATAAAVLTPGQRRQGALVLDFGALRTTYASYRHGVLWRSGCLPFGCLGSAGQKGWRLTLDGLLQNVRRAEGVETLAGYPGGVHLTGGGAQSAELCQDLAARFAPTGTLVRRGEITGLRGEARLLADPRYATVLGLLKTGLS